MLGVMKVGAAFVLLDPISSLDRLQQILLNVASPLLLTSATSSQLACMLGVDFLILEETLPLADSDDAGKITASDVTPDNAVYAVFTSGSTGKPKEAVVSHAAYASCAAHLQAPLQLRSQSRVMQLSSYVFDVSILRPSSDPARWRLYLHSARKRPPE